VIGVLTADCGPVLFADAQAGVIGAAHAGWRGAFDGVLESTIEACRHWARSAPASSRCSALDQPGQLRGRPGIRRPLSSPAMWHIDAYFKASDETRDTPCSTSGSDTVDRLARQPG
jgi:hypothetical protein